MILVYDGDCAFCSTSARLLQRWVPTAAEVLPWQRADLAALELTPEQCDAAVQWVDGSYHREGAAAIAAVLRTGDRAWWRVLGRGLGSRPGLVVADPTYRWVARNRDRLPGGTAARRVPER